MRIQYIRVKESHWSYDDKLAERLGRQALARRMRARKRVNTILGAVIAGIGTGQEPLKVLAEAEKGAGARKREGAPGGARFLCEL